MGHISVLSHHQPPNSKRLVEYTKKKFIHPLEARTWQECGVDTNESIHAQLPLLKS
jgi:hypothetical protein